MQALLLFCSCQTPEKKTNDQRSRKRKGDIYDSNSQGKFILLIDLPTETAPCIQKYSWLHIWKKLVVIIQSRMQIILNGILWLAILKLQHVYA